MQQGKDSTVAGGPVRVRDIGNLGGITDAPIVLFGGRCVGAGDWARTLAQEPDTALLMPGSAPAVYQVLARHLGHELDPGDVPHLKPADSSDVPCLKHAVPGWWLLLMDDVCLAGFRTPNVPNLVDATTSVEALVAIVTRRARMVTP